MLFGPVASHGFQHAFPPCPSIRSSWKDLQSYYIFLCLCPFLPNEEDTVLSGNLLAYFKCDRAGEVSKIIMLLQAQWKINGLVEKEGLLWRVQECLEIVHLKLIGKQTWVIPGFMEALFCHKHRRLFHLLFFQLCFFSSSSFSLEELLKKFLLL